MTPTTTPADHVTHPLGRAIHLRGPSTDPDHIAQIRSTEMNSLQEVLSRSRQAELLREAEQQRLALSLHRAQRLERRAQRASRRADRASWQARLALVRAS